MAENFTTPNWIKAQPHASAEFMLGDESGGSDVVNRPAKTLWNNLKQIARDIYVNPTLDGHNTASLSDTIRLRTLHQGYTSAKGGVLAKLNTARSRGMAAATVYNRQLLFIGGGRDPIGDPTNPDSYTPGTATNEVWAYLVDTDEWVQRTSMPTARRRAIAVVAHDKVHVIGGADDLGVLTAHEQYDPITDTWLHKAPLPAGLARYGALAAYLPPRVNNPEGTIHIFTGSDALLPYIDVLNDHLVYDIANDVWGTLPGRSQLRFDGAATTTEVFGNGHAILTGGITNDGVTIVTETYTYDDVTRAFTARAAMPGPRAKHGIALGIHPTLNDMGVFVMGGVKQTHAPLTPGTDVEEPNMDVYHVRTNTWVRVGNISVTDAHVRYPSIVGFEGRVFIMGGSHEYITGTIPNVIFHDDDTDAMEAYVTGLRMLDATKTGIACARVLSGDAIYLANLTTGQTGNAVATREGDLLGVAVAPAWKDKAGTLELMG